MTLPPPPRRPLPLSVKLAVALRELGVKETEIDWSHEPALQLRAYDERDYSPAQHDPAFLFIRRKAEHAAITFKDNGTGRGDLTAIAHVKRVSRKQEEFRRRMLAKDTGEPVREQRSKYRWGKGQKIRSRGFQRRRT